MTGEPLFVERPRAIGILPHGVRELPEGSFLVSQCNAPQDGGLSFSPAGAHGCALREKKKHPRSSRGCVALAGAIGIEPTPWESEAHVLPLHQAPTRK